MVKAAIYYRAYPQEADTQTQVLERRKQLCLACAEAHGYAIDNRLYAEGINTVGIERTGLQKLWLLVGERTIDTLLVPDLMQLSTIPAQLVGMLATLKNAGINVVTVNNPDLKLDEINLHLQPITMRDAETLSLAQYVEATRALQRQQPELSVQSVQPVNV
jgi:DNA invertase Pin-like site-specific DNA recombinase